MFDELRAAGCPKDLADHLTSAESPAVPVAAVFPPGFWIGLAKQFGPVVFQIAQAVISQWLANQKPSV